MKRKNPIALLFGWLALSLTPNHGAQAAEGNAATAAQQTGSITGRVKNVATGQYLNNARVAVEGTRLLTFTDESGTYRLAGVSNGPAVLEVFYTGLDEQKAPVMIAANQTVEHDVDLTNVARYGVAGDVVKLGSYIVASTRETDIEAIAINEQRFAPNIKNVVSTETLGDPLGGSMGDFLRYLPGVAAAYGALETDGILIRGFPSNLSVVSYDGVQLAGANAGGTRDFAASRVGVNSVSRVEVTKVPLPSTPADTMSGSINLVTKSAFERSRAEFKYRVGVTSNEQRFSLKKTPAPDNEETYWLYPDVSFDYTLPLGKNLGLVITGMTSKISFETDTWYTDYRASGTGTGATAANPYMWRNRNVEVSRDYHRSSLSGKVDWRATTHSVISVGAMVSYYDHQNHNSQFNPTVGAVGTPTVAGGTPLTYTPEQVIGATGRGAVPMAFSFSNHLGMTQTGNIRYRLDDGIWKIQSSLSRSNSKAWARYTDRGFFSGLGVALKMPVRVTYTGINDGRVGDFQVFDNNNQAVDVFDVNNYIVTSATGANNIDTRATITTGDLDIKRQLTWLAFPAAIQIGGMQRKQTSDAQRLNGRVRNYNGINGDRSAAPYLAEVYYGARKFKALESKPHVPWISPYKVWEAFAANPDLFTQTTAQQRATASNNILNSKYIQETVSAVYVQGEARFFDNRLSMVTGVRFEKTTDKGMGPVQDPDAVYVRNANGTFARTGAGARIRKPEAGAPRSVDEVSLIYQERAALAERSYEGYYPSLHLNYNITSNLLARAAYAKTYGRPNFNNIIPNTTVNQDDDLDADPDEALGRISYSNIGLKPWSAHNFDLSLEYYTDQGGVISGGVFLKEVSDFFGNRVIDATAEDLEELGLDSRYLGWRVTSKFNSGSARVQGAELNVRHSLVPFGQWGRHVIVFANATKLKLEGDTLADFTGFLPESVNWGFTLTKNRVTFISKWSYRGEQKAASYPTMGPGAFRHPQPRLQLDLSLDVQVGKRTLVYFNLRNATNALQQEYAYGPDTPDYARHFYHGRFGRIFTVGVKGTF